MPDKVLAFYIRLSSEDRDLKTNALKNESNSVFNQRRLLQDYYDTHESLHGYKVIVFCDDGVTGTHFDRPKFDELIEMARNQEIHCIMVKDLSRFGRNFLEMGNYLELILPLYGVRFISINDAFDSDDYLGVKAKLFCPEIAGLFCRIAGLFCHDSRANLSLKPVCFGIAIS